MLLTRASLFSCRGGLIVVMLANSRAALASTSILPERQEYAKGDFSHRVKVAAQERRNLQSTCSAEKAFTVTSSVLPLTEGCYFHSKTEEDKDIYIADTNTAFAYSQVVQQKANEEYWVLAQNEDGFTTNSEGYIVCISQEVFEDVAHPADATWECDIDGDGTADNFNTTEFSTSCGCPDTPAPTVAPIRVLPINGTCRDPLDEILVKSAFDPDLEGCYKETPSIIKDLPTYTVSGTNASEQIYVQAQQQDDSTLVNWILAYIPMDDDPDDFVLYCYSEEEAEDVHPSEVETWYCDTDDGENSNPIEVAWTDFDVLCGCTPPSSSLDSPAPYPAPTSSPFTTSTSYSPSSTSYPPASTSHSFQCGGAEDQFQITSTEVIEIYGECFTAANASSSNDTIIYTPDGTRNVGQFFVTPAKDQYGKFRWLIGFAPLEGEYDEFYLSREEAATVHPTEATWEILPDADATGSGPTELVIDCGCQSLDKITLDKSATTSKLPVALPAIIWGIMIVTVSMIFVSTSEP